MTMAALEFEAEPVFAHVSVMLSEVGQAERALDGIKPLQGGRPDHHD